MIYPLAPQIAALKQHIPSELVSGQALEAVHKLSKNLPPIWGFAGLETRLTDDPRVDMLVCVSQMDDGYQELKSRIDGAKWPALRPIMPFFKAWTQSEGALHSHIPFINVEFDFPTDTSQENPSTQALSPRQNTPQARDPMALICVESTFAHTGDGPSLDAIALVKTTQAAIGAVQGAEVSDKTWDKLQFCAQSLPEGGRFLHIGVMHSRGNRDLRTLISIPRDQIHTYLTTIGWPGSHQALDELLALIGPHWPRISLQLDIGETIGEAIAIEHYLTKGPEKHPSWERLRDALIDRGLATKERIDGALSWWGSERVDHPDLAWVIQLIRMTDIKITLRNAHDWSAKAYLGFYAKTRPF